MTYKYYQIQTIKNYFYEVCFSPAKFEVTCLCLVNLARRKLVSC